MKSVLLVAAERREFDGIRKRLGPTVERKDLGLRFACEATREGYRWLMIANGPGRELAGQALSESVMRKVLREQVDGESVHLENGHREYLRRVNVKAIISTGFCGALDPKLRVGDIVVSEHTELNSSRTFTRGPVTTCDRVAVTRAEKQALRAKTGAIAVDMEAAAVESRARDLGVPYACIRVVSDTAEEDLPMDFNRYRTADGNFSRTKIAFAAMARPFSVMPALMEFDRRCQRASAALGDFLADCRF
jgi:adenosylhomocysteine nucleosidase